MNKKVQKIKNTKYALITLFLLAIAFITKFNVLGATEDAGNDYKLISIIFIIVDIVLFFVMYFMIKKYKSLRKKINVEKNLQAYTIGAFLAFTQNLFIILVVLCVILFLTICELAYLIRTSKNELADLKEQAQKRSDELNKLLESGNISYVMTIDGWYEIATEECYHLSSIGENPITYLMKEIEKEEKAAVRDDARIGGLKKALEEQKNKVESE